MWMQNCLEDTGDDLRREVVRKRAEGDYGELTIYTCMKISLCGTISHTMNIHMKNVKSA